MKKTWDILLILGTVFLSVGLVLLALGGFAWQEAEHFSQNAVTVPGEILWIDYDDDEYEVYVAYEYAGRTFREELDFHSSNMRVGDVVSLSIHPMDPDDPRMQGMEALAAWILAGIGGLFALMGGSFVLVRLLIRRRRRLLLDIGRPTEATVTAVSLNRMVRVNRRHPWKVTCTDSDGRIYTSHNIYSSCEGMEGQKVTVYVHPFDDRKYHVDVEKTLERLHVI